MRRLPALTAALVALAAPAVAGCGGGPSYARPTGDTLRITVDEYHFDPQDFEIPAGTVHLVLHNAGRLTHDVAIETFDPQPGEEPTVYGRTRTAQPGETVREEAPIVLRPGKYRLACLISNHDDLGEYGELKVVGG